MLDRLREALNRLLCAVAEDDKKGAGHMEQDCGDGGKGKEDPPRDDITDGIGKPPHDDEPVEDITYRDGVVEVNITSDFDGEITMNQDTKDAVNDLMKACGEFLNGEVKPDDLKAAMARVGGTEDMGGSATSTSGAPPAPKAPDAGGDRPPFVTVNVNVTQAK